MTVINWLDQSGLTDACRQIWREESCFPNLSTKLPLQDLWISPMKLFLILSKRTRTKTGIRRESSRCSVVWDLSYRMRTQICKNIVGERALKFPFFMYTRSNTVLQLGGLIFFKHIYTRSIEDSLALVMVLKTRE